MESESQHLGRILVDQGRSIYIQHDSMARNKVPRRLQAKCQEGKKQKFYFGDLTCFNEARAIYTKLFKTAVKLK